MPTTSDHFVDATSPETRKLHGIAAGIGTSASDVFCLIRPGEATGALTQ